MGADLVARARALFEELDGVAIEERIELVNELRIALGEHSPLQGEPVDLVLWVKAEEVRQNDYNPNSVAPPEMLLLERSIKSDGYTQPLVCSPGDGFEVVDGFHRHRVGRESPEIAARLRGRLPITCIRPDRSGRLDRIASTIRHNRARGKHGIDAMSRVVLELARRNWSLERIGRELGMEPDEVLRLQQIQGLASMFADRDFSGAWEMQRADE